MNNTYKTAAGGLTVTFAATDQGLFLAGLTDEVSSRTYLREIQPLFSLEYECLESGEQPSPRRTAGPLPQSMRAKTRGSSSSRAARSCPTSSSR